MNESMGEW